MSGDKILDKIEETQTALRESIEQAKDLAEKSEQLIAQHREGMAGPHYGRSQD